MEVGAYKVNLRISIILLFCFFMLYPLASHSQWAKSYMTGSGFGYQVGATHDTFDGYLEGDSLITFGMQLIGASGSYGFEFIQDSYGKQTGSFGSSKIIYQWDGSFTTNRKRQVYRRYPNGYIVNKNSTGDFDTERFFRNFDGSLVRRDTLHRKLVRTFQVKDTTNSFLTTSAHGGFELIDWFSYDTIQSFEFSSLVNDYQGSLDPNNWEIFEYHNDGQYIYLRAFESHLIQSYGYDILKLDITTGRLSDFYTFEELSPNISIGQEFLILVEDTVIDQGPNYVSQRSLYDGNRQKILSLSYTAEKFYGAVSGSVVPFFNDSIIIFNTTITDSRVGPNETVRGSHLRVYDIKQRKWLGNARFQGALPGNNFDVSKIIDVKGGYIYLTTQTEAGSSDIDLLVCLPLDLNYTNSLFLRTVSEKEVKTGSLDIYPNPVEDRLRVKFGSTFTELQFYNMAGSFVGKIPYSEENNYSTSFLSPGIYSVAIVDGSKVLAERKLIKKLD